MTEYLVEMRLRTVGEVIEHQRSVRGHRFHVGTLVVEYPQRVDLGAPSGVLVERKAEEELLQQVPVPGTAGLVAERGDLEPESLETEAPQSVGYGTCAGTPCDDAAFPG